ncbi:MAG: RpiB/LacA/LacB family sugar-phosphate isomerase [Bacilli bacterium]|nr:RpiB/LacA/LacB family sugar-phosphate isomerase [Bacilli bacterium]
MKIGIGNDHRGYELKKQITEYLESLGYDVINYGSDSEESVDYPIYAFKVGEAIKNKEIDRGILICRTGIGMSIACNKVKGVRCAKVDNVEEAALTRIDNDSNVIAISYVKNITEIKEILKNFLEIKFSEEERHVRRIKLIDTYGE